MLIPIKRSQVKPGQQFCVNAEVDELIMCVALSKEATEMCNYQWLLTDPENAQIRPVFWHCCISTGELEWMRDYTIYLKEEYND